MTISPVVWKHCGRAIAALSAVVGMASSAVGESSETHSAAASPVPEGVRELALKGAKHPDVLANAARAAAEAGQPILALALYRRALHFDANQFQARQGLKWAESQIQVPTLPHDFTWTEGLRRLGIELLPLRVLTALTALLFLTTFASALRLQRKKRGLGLTALSGILFFIAVSLSGAGVWLFLEPRGTVIATTVPVRTAPDHTAPSLFDVSAGQELIIRRDNGAWIQVTYPGALTGWMESTALVPNSGEKLGFEPPAG